MKKTFILIVIVMLCAAAVSRATAGCRITWTGGLSGSIATNETSRTQQAAQELFAAIQWQYYPDFCPNTVPVRDWYGTCYSNGCFYPMCGDTPTLKQDVCLDGSWAEYTAMLFTCNLGQIGSGLWDVTCEATLIELSSFMAVPKSEGIILLWSTESEIDNAGFNIYRAEAEGGAYTRINAALIPAKGSSTEGASYEFIDSDVKNRKTYYYKLEDIDFNGVSTLHGPVSATPRLILWL
jgi:hypothetical protein